MIQHVCAGFLLYCLVATAVILYLIVSVAPTHGNSNVFVYLAICSLVGSLSVMSVKVSQIASKVLYLAGIFLWQPLVASLNCCIDQNLAL